MKSTIRNIATYITLKENQQVLPLIQSVDIPGAKTIPQGRFVGVYGLQGTLAFFKEVRRSAPRGLNVRRVNLRIDVGTTPANPLTTLARLPETYAVHLNFLSTDMQQYIKSLIQIQDQSISQVIAYDPELLNTLWSDEAMSHVRFFCWQHPTDTNPQFQLGAVASPDFIAEIDVQNFRHQATPEVKFF